MPGIIYLILCILLGKEWIGSFMLKRAEGQGRSYNCLWLLLPASFGVGTLFMTWETYLVSWLISVWADVEEPLFYGNLIVMCLAAVQVLVTYVRRHRKKGREREKGNKAKAVCRESLISDKRLFSREAVFFALLLVFLTWIMFYVFYMRDGVLYSGFTVYGDYAPHTSMIRSFSWQNNFPTQYPHFGGEDVKYHFMFQFLTGNLEYLGMRMDLAYNIVSIFSIEGFLMLLYSLAVRLTGMASSGVLAVGLFFFRSGLTFFRFVWEHLKAGDLWVTLKENTAFIGYTPNENWGLWNFNVYLNQRHLAFGLLLVCVALWIYLDWVEAGTSHPEKGLHWFRDRLFSKEAWKSRNPEAALLVGLILGWCAFWNGAAVIGGLLILMGFAVFSDGKIDYAVTALATVVFSVLQSRIFIQGQAMSISFYWGFLAEKKTLPGVLWYVFQISGIFFLGLPAVVFLFKRRERAVMLGFLFPAVFAFGISLTPDINVNHKYIMISYAFFTIFWAAAIIKLWKKAKGIKPLAVLLAICLTATGIYDFVVILKDNDAGHRVGVNMNSALTKWLGEHLDSGDLILTPEYSMNEVTMSGVMMYCGWPYYAWSAGYDTNYRADRAVEIYTSSDAEEVKRIVDQEKITYILFEENMEFEQEICREDIIAQAYPRVYTSEDGRFRIYKTS